MNSSSTVLSPVSNGHRRSAHFPSTFSANSASRLDPSIHFSKRALKVSKSVSGFPREFILM